jgi:hypothetical protein
MASQDSGVVRGVSFPNSFPPAVRRIATISFPMPASGMDTATADPSWYVLGKPDKIIVPAQQATMAERATSRRSPRSTPATCR